VPLTAGNVIVVDPATAGPTTVNVPEVEPVKTIAGVVTPVVPFMETDILMLL
jgi:hypothetical protein